VCFDGCAPASQTPQGKARHGKARFLIDRSTGVPVYFGHPPTHTMLTKSQQRDRQQLSKSLMLRAPSLTNPDPTHTDRPTMVRTFMPQPGQESAQITLARRMFWAGCLGLPWLHLVNVWYFWPKAFGAGAGGRAAGAGAGGGASGARHASPELVKCALVVGSVWWCRLIDLSSID
jgi:hypothetical protein